MHPAAPELPATPGRTLCLMPTFACNASCRHCGTFSSPRVTGRLTNEALVGAIQQAAERGYTDVVFSGGEPTLSGEMLLRAMLTAKQHGMQVRLVTNAQWASTPDTADAFVAGLRAHGLTVITISTGDEHARFVPVGHVLNAVRACAAQAVPVFVSVETAHGRALTPETLEAHPEMQSIRRDHPAARILVCAWLWSPLSPSRTQGYAIGATVHAGNVQQRGRCPDMFATTTVQADGTVSPCCGLGIRFVPELRLGSIATISLAEADRRAKRDFLLRWIHAEGPERILAWAATHDHSIEWEHRYAHQCQACVRLFGDPNVRAVIAAHGEEKFAEVAFLESLLLPAEAG